MPSEQPLEADPRSVNPSCCVILAAGEGSGPSSVMPGRPKPLTRVLGLTLAERAVASCMAVGVDHFVVVLGCRASDVRAHYERIAARRGCAISFVEAADWKLGSGASARAARTRVASGPFLLLLGDHLISASLLARLLQAAPGPGQVHMAVDRNREALPDPSSARKVGLAGNRVTRVGEAIRWWSAADAGAYLCHRDLFDALDRAAAAGGHDLTHGLSQLAEEGRLVATSVTGELWMDVGSQASLRAARVRLLASLTRGSSDGFVAAHLNRRLSLRLTTRLVERSVTPNQITVASFLAALVGAALLATGQYMPGVLGALLVQASAVADSCDGELARLKHEVTALGGWLDTVLDRYADLAVVMAVTFAQASSVSGIRPWLGGSLAATGFLLASYVTKEFALRHGREYPNDVLNRLRRRDLRLFGICLGALLGRAFEAMVLLGLISHLCAAGMLLRAWRRQGPFGYRAA